MTSLEEKKIGWLTFYDWTKQFMQPVTDLSTSWPTKCLSLNPGSDEMDESEQACACLKRDTDIVL